MSAARRRAAARALTAAVLAGSFGAGCLASGCGRAAPPPDVLLVTLDTTRVDHLSAYGYERDTSPNLRRLAAESVRFARAWSTSPWTLPAHASLFTGLSPRAHGAHSDPAARLSLADAIDGPLAPMSSVRKLGEDAVTLAELLVERGYRTAAVVGGPWLRSEFGLLQGFEHRDDGVVDATGRRGDELTDAALAWLAGVGPREPVFLFVNYFDPHWPYEPPEGYDGFPGARAPLELGARLGEFIAGRRTLTAGQRAALVARYDGEIRFADAQLGRLLDAFRARPGGDRALVVVTSDHGEAFGEGDRLFHTYWLSEEILRVPLVVRHPDGRDAGRVEQAPAQLTDVLGWIAADLGLSLPGRVEARPPGERDVAFAELYRHKLALAIAQERFDRDLEAVIRWPFKLVRSDRGQRELLRVGDVWERSEPAPPEPTLVAELEARLDAQRRLAAPGSAAPPVVDRQTREVLRALGYVE